MITCCTGEAPTPHGAGRFGAARPFWASRSRCGPKAKPGFLLSSEGWSLDRRQRLVERCRHHGPELGLDSAQIDCGGTLQRARQLPHFAMSSASSAPTTRPSWWRAASTGVCRAPTCSRSRRTSTTRRAPDRGPRPPPSPRPTPRPAGAAQWIRLLPVPRPRPTPSPVPSSPAALPPCAAAPERLRPVCRTVHACGCNRLPRRSNDAPYPAAAHAASATTTQRARSVEMPDITELAGTM